MAVNHCCIDLKHSARGSARHNVRKVYISYTRKLVCLLFHNMVLELDSLPAAAEAHLVADEGCNPTAFLVPTSPEARRLWRLPTPDRALAPAERLSPHRAGNTLFKESEDKIDIQYLREKKGTATAREAVGWGF